jgi:hypothetical protein
VIGEAEAIEPLASTRRWEGAFGSPVSQETSSDHKAEALVERGGSMKHKYVFRTAAVFLSLGAMVTAPSALAAGHSPKVNIRVEGLTKTLIAAEQIQTKSGTVTRTGHPIVGTTALGALNTATEGHWAGSWSAQYSEWSVIGILGESHAFSSKYFWAVYGNHTEASAGAGEVNLKAGDKIVYAVLPDKDYDETLLGATAPATATVHKAFKLKLVDYNAKGKPVPLKGATLKFDGKSIKVHGSTATITPKRHGTLTIRVSKAGYVRTEATLKVSP